MSPHTIALGWALFPKGRNPVSDDECRDTLNPPVTYHTQQGREKVRVQTETAVHVAQGLCVAQENAHMPSAVRPEGGRGREFYSLSRSRLMPLSQWRVSHCLVMRVSQLSLLGVWAVNSRRSALPSIVSRMGAVAERRG